MLPPKSRLGDYEILKHLGSGSFGDVYRARHCSTGEIRALKLCRGQNPEAEVLRQLQHPGIVTVVGEFTDEHGHVTVMTVIDGVPLASLLSAVHHQPRQGLRVAGALQQLHEMDFQSTNDVFPAERFVPFGCRIVLQTAKALAYAHSRQICHRDVKPENILVTTEGSAVLIDWGVASGQELTDAVTGGTLNYMRSESLKRVAGLQELSPKGDSENAESSSHRDDIFALGIVLYELIAGELPFPPAQRDSLLVVSAREMLANRQQLAGTIAGSNMSSALRTIVTACLSEDDGTAWISSRPYRNMQELVDDLQSYVSDRPLQHVRETWAMRGRRWWRRHRVLWTTLLLVVAVSSGFFLADRFQTSRRLQGVEDFRKQVVHQGVTTGMLPAEIESAVFSPGIFPDGQSLQHKRATVAHGLAATYLAQGHPATAVSLLKHADTLKPLDGDLKNDLGAALFRLGEYEPAVAEFDQALRLPCDHAAVLSNRGAAKAAMGNADAARLDFIEALEIDPRNQAANNHLQLLESNTSETSR